MSQPESRLPLRQALALGALHGPAELLPISSSAHTALVPWLLGWPSATLDGELRKAFEVALHAGTAAALMISWRDELLRVPRPTLLVGALAPPVLAGLTLERPIERRLGTPTTIAIGLLAGAAAMVLADERRDAHRRAEDVGALDALALGIAQACALVPGVSRCGMTLAAARARGFDRESAAALSREVALPVLAGAATLKGVRLARRGLAPELRRAFVGGGTAAFATTLACAGGARLGRRGRALAPFAAYRAGLAALVLARLRARSG